MWSAAWESSSSRKWTPPSDRRPMAATGRSVCDQPDARVFEGVPMSTSDTGRAQLHRFHHLGMRVAELESLRDVDTIEDARVVASESPVTRFAGELAQLALAPI